MKTAKAILGLVLPVAVLGGASGGSEGPPPVPAGAERPPFWSEAPFRAAVQVPADGNRPALAPPRLGYTRPSTAPDDVPDEVGVHVIGVRIVRGQEVTRACAAVVGSPVVIQGDWARSLVALPRRPGEAREIMLALERSFPGRWWKLGPAWVLARTREEAELSALLPADRLRLQRQELQRLLASLDGGARARLEAGEEIGVRHLLPAGRTALRAVVRLAYYRPDWEDPRSPEVPSEAALRGGVLVSRVGQDRAAALQIRDEARTYLARFPLDDAATGASLLDPSPPL